MVLLKLKAKPPKSKKKTTYVFSPEFGKKEECGFFLFLLFPTFFYYCHLHAMFLCKNLQEVTGRTSSPA